jgi:hypothetical protein
MANQIWTILISHFIIPCSRIAVRIQHLIYLWIPFYHETDDLVMQISFSDVIKWGRLSSNEFGKCIDKKQTITF